MGALVAVGGAVVFTIWGDFFFAPQPDSRMMERVRQVIASRFFFIKYLLNGRFTCITLIRRQ
jgi:hypothetical protein